MDKELKPGTATVQISFTGILNSELRGFYLGKDEQGRKYAVTQFESTDARRAFPSFDEPGYKATFDITVVADKGMVAISNSKSISDTPGPGDKHTVKFETTPKMSSYLAAIAVGNFEYIEGSADGIPIRIWSTPGKKELGRFALESSENIMRYFNKYFGIKYPYGKLDEIGLPDFSAGAMENTGFITYREVILLLDEKHASVGLKKGVAEVISHEMAHQWFGDLVTMQWWDDIWLNEGFATWMANKPLESWKPEWNLDQDDVSDSGTALRVDALANTRPIHQPAETPAEILELFDGIAYGKAASVLRMLEAYLGPETFRAGVNEYLKQHAYANSTADDFWSTLARVSKKPVDKIMPTFVKQAGAPILSLQAKCEGNSQKVTLNQQRYFYGRALLNAGSTELWLVPVCMKNAPGKAAHCELMTKKEETFTLPGCSTWVLSNAGAAGYYHSSYSPEVALALANAAETALTPGERIALLEDTWAAIRVGRQPVGDYLALAEGLKADRNRGVLEEVLGQLAYINDVLVTDSDRESYQAWTRRLLNPIANEVGWDPKPGESDEQKSLRAELLGALGESGHDPDALAVARKLADRVLDDPDSVDGDLANVALALAAKNGDAALYDKVLAKTKAPKTPEVYYLYLGALEKFSDPKLLQRTLELALSSDVRFQDSLGVVSGVMFNPAGEQLGWDFVRTHWPEIEKAGGPFASGQIVAASGSFCDAQKRDEMKEFFSTHKVEAAERTLKQSLERVNYCVDLKASQSPQLATWLGQHANSAAGTSGGK